MGLTLLSNSFKSRRFGEKTALLAATAMAAALATPSAAEAQEAPPIAEAQPIESEIIVTARKRAETAQDVPLALVAIGEEEIKRRDLTSFEKLSNQIPGFVVASPASGSGAQMYMRGIGSTSTSIGIEQSVAVVLDGVYYGNGRVIKEGFFDAARIEVLKGPQALFYGKNATAGVVSITTQAPTDYLTGFGSVGYEFRSQKVTGSGVVSGPLTDTLSARVAVRGSKMFDALIPNVGTAQTYTTRDIARGGLATVHPTPIGDRDNPAEKDFMARLSLQWEPHADLTARLIGTISENEIINPSWNQVIYACPTGFMALAPTVPCERKFRTYDRNFAPDIAKNFLNARDDGEIYNNYSAKSLTGIVEYQIGDIALSSISNYQDNHNVLWFDSQHQPQSIVGVFGTEESEWRAISSEFRVTTSFDGPLNAMTGAYYQNTKRTLIGASAIAGVEDSSVAPSLRYVTVSKDSETDGETISAFGQVIWNIVPEVELSGGVRYLHETKDSFFLQPYANALRVAQGRFVVGVPITADQTFSNWSPEASLTWEITPDITTYAAYRTGFKSGGFSNNSNFSTRSSVEDLTFEPETAKGFEVGLKTMLFDRALKFNLIAYTFEFSNLQVDFFDAANQAFNTTNAGSARSKGIDLELAWTPRQVEGLSLYTNVSYNKTRYVQYIAPCYAGQTIAMGCTLTAPNGGPRQDISGASPANAPLWAGSAGFYYETPVGGFLLGLSGDARYSDEYQASFFNQPLSRQPDYVTFDGSVRLMAEDRQWELALLGRNLTNRFIVVGSFDNPATGSAAGRVTGVLADAQGPVRNPRTVELLATFRF